MNDLSHLLPPPTQPNQTQPHPIPQHVPKTYPNNTWGNTDTITNTTPGNANKTSTIHLRLKM